MGHNYMWNQNVVVNELLDFLRSIIHLFNPQQWLLEFIMVCSERTGTHDMRMLLNNVSYRVAKTRVGVLSATNVSKGHRPPLWLAMNYFSGFLSLKHSYDRFGNETVNYLPKQLFELQSEYAIFVNMYILSCDNLSLRVWRVLTVMIQSYTDGWMTANSVSSKFLKNCVITAFENSISMSESSKPTNY